MGRPAGTGARSHSSSGTQQEEEGGERGRERRNERERERASGIKKHISVVSLKGVREWALRLPGGVELLFLDSF